MCLPLGMSGFPIARYRTFRTSTSAFHVCTISDRIGIFFTKKGRPVKVAPIYYIMWNIILHQYYSTSLLWSSWSLKSLCCS